MLREFAKMFGQKLEKTKIQDSKKQKLLGVEINRILSFNEYIALLCRKAGKKLFVLARLSKFMCTNKKRVLMKAFIESQFGYFPLIWMFQSSGVNNNINPLHEQSLRIVNKDNISTFEDFLKVISGLLFIRRTSHQQLQNYLLHMFKIKSNLSNNIVQHFSKQKK